MKCGVRFCGGCNPRYDRRLAFDKLKEMLPDVEFQYAQESELYDKLLVICGCTSCCASYDMYSVRDGGFNNILKLWDAADVERTAQALGQEH